MKNKYILPIIVFLILLIAGGGYFLFTRNQSNTTDEGPSFFEEEATPLDPSEIGLEIVPRSDNQAVKLVLNKASDIETIEFDIVYEADLSGGGFDEDGGVGRVTRNVTDELKVNGESPFETKFYDLGSCSSGRCRYDTGVTEVMVVMKVVKDDGMIYQVEDSISLE